MKSFVVDAERCTGCKLCVVSCKDEHVGNEHAPWAKPQPDTGHFWIDVRSLERGKLPRVKVTHLPMLCQHCASAPCIKVCPEQAIRTREDGLVWIDAAACSGCGLCKEACPYDVIFMNEELAIAQKCTGCAHRVDAGELPRCVEACPHDAIVMAEDGRTSSPQAASAAGLEVFHPEFNARPRVLWKGLPKPWIVGMAIDAAGDETLEGVTVTALDLFDDTSVVCQSDAFGDFWLRQLASGHKYRVELRKNGYEAVALIVTTAGDQDLGTIALQRARPPKTG